MTIFRLLICLTSAALAAGCAQLPRHEVDISGQLREQPLKSVVLFPVVFPTDPKRNDPDDFPELNTENLKSSESAILQALTRAMGASIIVDSSVIPGREHLEWSEKIGNDLILGRVPLAVPPVDLEVEAVLLTAAIAYGSELNQYSYQLFPFLPRSKPRYFGKPRWDHACDLEILLVRPKDGHILCHVRHAERKTHEQRSAEILESLTAATAKVISTALQAGRER